MLTPFLPEGISLLSVNVNIYPLMSVYSTYVHYVDSKREGRGILPALVWEASLCDASPHQGLRGPPYTGSLHFWRAPTARWPV